jgi:hypothetical protein
MARAVGTKQQMHLHCHQHDIISSVKPEQPVASLQGSKNATGCDGTR